MDKAVVFGSLVESMRRVLDAATAASKDAADYATNEEARATSPYDTQNIEASYLAAGQAGQVRLMAEALQILQAQRDKLLAPQQRAGLGALVQVDYGRNVREWFFISPAGGGQTVAVQDQEVTVISERSPLASRLSGKAAGSSLELPNGALAQVLAVE